MAALIGLLISLLVVAGAVLAQQPTPPSPEAQCQENLGAFRVMAERMNLNRVQLELNLAATENRLQAALAEVERLKKAAEPKKDK